MEIKLPYALDNSTGKLIHARDAIRGGQFMCPCCHQWVILKKGQVRIPHFAHRGVCVGAVETILHKLCKQIISEYPDKCIRRANGEWFPYAEAQIEYPLAGRAIDVMLIAENADLLAVEIYVTHPLTEEKVADLRKANCPALEIVVPIADLYLPQDELQYKLIHGIAKKKDFDILPIPGPVITSPQPVAADYPIYRDPFDWAKFIIGGALIVFGIFLAWLIFRSPKKKRPGPAYAYAYSRRNNRR
jgi:hypothetical protein